jgi:ABC-type uncharacterized transport system YnjBCD substrate-binding protein|tara:strand:- start:69 stop:302 length:234 start_codon:yes stop_codon:yes gene_type:complete
MKKIIIILLAFTLTTNAQERKKCVTTTIEKVGEHKVKVIRKNTCGDQVVIKIQTYLMKDWRALQKKRKLRIKKRKNK